MWRKTLESGNRKPEEGFDNEEETKGQDKNLISLLLRNGKVQRYHTRPIIGQQTVASHCWGVATIILRLCPDPRLELIKAALWHDLAEGFVGDVPYTLREYDEQIKAKIDKLETELLREQFGIEFVLSLDERNWLKCADMYELCHEAKHQIDLGNKYAYEILINGLIYLTEMNKPKELHDEFEQFKQSIRTELPELFESE